MKLEGPGNFVGIITPELKGDISPDSTYLTSALLEETDLEIQVSCTVSIEKPKLLSSGKALSMPMATSKCSLDIILYGPKVLSEPICEFIDESNEYLEDGHKLYLQDPVGCERNVPYCNPHRLPPLNPDSIQYTFDLASKRQYFVELDITHARPELLDLLDSQEELPEAFQPSAIATTLER